MQLGKTPKHLSHPHHLYQSKYHCYIAYFEIFSLGVWKRSTCLCSTRSSREDHHLFRPFLLGSIGGPANLCDSVATECLPAAECSALQQPSPYRSLNASLRIPTDWLPSSSSPWPPGQEQLSQNWPTCIKFTTTAAPVCPQQPLTPLSLRLSPARITLSRDGDV